MKGGGWVFLPLVVVLASCGLETVESLDPPFGDSYYLDPQLTDRKLSFDHGSQYEGTSFLGYLIYYRIYPISPTEDFARLLEDRDRLSASPTVNQLVSMGYSSMTMSRNKESSSTGLDGVLIEAPSGGTEIAMDFSDFLDTPTSEVPPLLLIGGTVAEAPYLYRSMALAGRPAQKFSTLRTATTREADTAPLTPEQLSAREYEVTFFVIAYGLDAKLNEIYSKPAPWGIIRTIAP